MGTKLTRRAFIGRSVVQLGVTTAAGRLPGPEAGCPAASRPNLLFVFSDQHSADMLGCCGNSRIIAPAGIVWNCLFDRAADPIEDHNLFDLAAHAGVRKRLHERTLGWMKQYEDEGLPYATIVQKVLNADDPEFARSESWSVLSGGLKGRPIDLLK